jgi:homotetrameric cytidine deaminase
MTVPETETTEADRALLAAAAEAAEQAYAPYSQLSVGAALQTATGEVVTGCNVENASYGLTCCAERNAVFAAVTRFGPDVRIARVGVVAHRADGSLLPVTPCGACRQVIAELATATCEIVYLAATGPTRRRLADLLPEAFGAALRPGADQ